MTYFHYHDSGGRVDEKVHALHVDVEERQDRLWCVATLELIWGRLRAARDAWQT